jgi:uncharacterized protein YecT (DUF1311 family)
MHFTLSTRHRAGLAIVASIFAAVACFSSEPSRAQTLLAPSFDCSKAKAKVEFTICHDQALASADALMAQLFAAVRVSAFGKGSSNEGQAQRKWLKDRSTACTGLKLAEQPPCLLEFLDRRNEELAVAALFTRPELALDTLRRLDPNGAPLMEAVFLYASEAPGGDWSSAPLASKRRRLLRLLQPYAKRFVTDDDLSFGRDILKDESISSADDALKTEESFASFVSIASAYIPDGPVPRAIPCVALVRHPKLIAMEGPVLEAHWTISSYPRTALTRCRRRRDLRAWSTRSTTSGRNARARSALRPIGALGQRSTRRLSLRNPTHVEKSLDGCRASPAFCRRWSRRQSPNSRPTIANMAERPKRLRQHSQRP